MNSSSSDGANVIPLGVRGRPGRGTGRTTPSAAARSLSGKPQPDREPQPPADDGSAYRDDPSLEATSSAPSLAAAGSQSADERATSDRSSPVPGVPVTEILSALTGAAQQVFGDEWERRAAEALAFLRRRLTGDYIVDEFGFDPELTSRFLMAALRPIATNWFRVEVRGIENIPDEGGALVVANHSGTIPMDTLMTMLAVHDHADRYLRPLGADLVFTMPFVSELARKGGATLACNADAERILSHGELVGVWPEGFKGIGKPYSERYKLQRFGRGGFVSAAIRTGVPIVPCSIVGAEEIYPLIGNIPSLARLLGVPYIPITPFFPLLGPLGLIPLPSKWLIEFGEPIRTDAYSDGAADDPMLVFNLTDQVRETIQQTLHSLLVTRDRVFF